MTRTRRIVLAIGGAIIALLAITPFLIPVNQFRPMIEAKASTALGRKVDVGRLSLSVLSGSLSAAGLAVADDAAFSRSPFLTAPSVKVGVELWPLIVSRSVSVTSITIHNPELALIRNVAGQWNYASLGSLSSAASEFSIKTLELKDGRVVVGAATSQKRSVYDHVEIAASNVSWASECPVSASAALPGGGTFTLAGSIGPVNRADVSRTPLAATIAIGRLNLATTGFFDSSAGLGGVLDLTATIASKNDEVAATGSATVSKALLVAGGSPASQAATVDFNTNYNLHTQSGVWNSSTLRIGGATGRVGGTYHGGGAHTLVSLKIVGEQMPAKDLESFFPALGLHLPNGASLATGTVAAHLNVVGTSNRLVTTGNVRLTNAKVSGFDLGAKVRAISAFTGLNTGRDLDIETLTTNLSIAPDGLRFDHFDAVIPSLGHLTGAGTVDARNRLDFKMVAMLTNPLGGGLGTAVGTIGALNEVLGLIAGGDAVSRAKGPRIPFLIRGTTHEPEFVADVSGLVLETLKQQARTQDANLLGSLEDLFKAKRR